MEQKKKQVVGEGKNNSCNHFLFLFYLCSVCKGLHQVQRVGVLLKLKFALSRVFLILEVHSTCKYLPFEGIK